MDDKIIVILVDRIKNQKINPFTNQPFKLEDIKIDAYRKAVTEKLDQVEPPK